jgi:hypothetical protein
VVEYRGFLIGGRTGAGYIPGVHLNIRPLRARCAFVSSHKGTLRGKPQPKRTRLALKLQITKYKLQRGALRADFNK